MSLYEGSSSLPIKSTSFTCIGVFDLLYMYKYAIDNLKKIRTRLKH